MRCFVDRRITIAADVAKHHGFSDEELDFIINYDIKYRMAQDAEEVEDA